jgi:hypothetical protein
VPLGIHVAEARDHVAEEGIGAPGKAKVLWFHDDYLAETPTIWQGKARASR